MNPLQAAGGIDAMGDEAIAAAGHAAAVEALARAGAGGLQHALRDLRAVLLSAEPEALRRSVGFWGRLLGRDIVLGAKADALRERAGVLLRQAGEEAERLHRQHDVLQAHSQRLRAACDGLQRDIDTLAHGKATADAARADAIARRQAHLATLRAAFAITASQLDVVAANARTVAERHAELLPRLAVLLEQQRGVRAGAEQGMRLSSARRTLDELERHIEHLPTPATQAAAPQPKEPR